MATLVATPDPTTGTVLIDVDQTVAYDTFSRIVANGWGTPDRGPAWTVSGGAAADYSVNGVSGDHQHTAANVDHRSAMALNVTDFEMTTVYTVSSVLFTGLYIINLFGRIGVNRYVAATLLGNPSGAVEVRLEYNLDSGNILTSNVTVPSVNTSSAIAIKFKACGTLLQAKVWDATVPEPAVFDIELSIPEVFSGSVEINTYTPPGTTPMPYTFSFDFFQVDTGNPVRLYRVTPDGVRTEVRGSAFNTSQAVPSIATIWDNEAPFDVEIFYELTSDCTSTVDITSNTVTLDSNGNGWIRDPATPANNILLTEDGAVYNDCDTRREITFLGWEPRVYANASGIFDVINSERPRTVSMRRKRYESQFSFATKTLDDMDLMESIFMPGTILLVNLPPSYGFGRPYGQDYITVMDLEQIPSSTDDFRVPYREWAVPFRLSSPPPDLNEGMTGSNGIGGGGATYADMTASAIGVTYATTTATGLTYQQLAQGVGY